MLFNTSTFDKPKRIIFVTVKNCKKSVKYIHSYRLWSCFTLPTETASQVSNTNFPNRVIPCQMQTPIILSFPNSNIWFIYPPISAYAHMKKIMACTPWDPRPAGMNVLLSERSFTASRLPLRCYLWHNMLYCMVCFMVSKGTCNLVRL
jgi:hypothetical protein